MYYYFDITITELLSTIAKKVHKSQPLHDISTVYATVRRNVRQNRLEPVNDLGKPGFHAHIKMHTKVKKYCARAVPKTTIFNVFSKAII